MELKRVCLHEHLDELRYVGDHEKKYYIRKVELRPIGYFDKGVFNEGVKYLPLIKDQAYLLEEDKLSDIYGEEIHGNLQQNSGIQKLLVSLFKQLRIRKNRSSIVLLQVVNVMLIIQIVF